VGGEQRLGRRVEHRATAERQHAVVVLQRPGDRCAFLGTEGGFTLVDEDVLDGLADPVLDEVVAVGEGDAQLGGHQLADGRLAGTHGADQDGPRSHLNLSESR
jgi:hypothetical protein